MTSLQKKNNFILKVFLSTLFFYPHMAVRNTDLLHRVLQKVQICQKCCLCAIQICFINYQIKKTVWHKVKVTKKTRLKEGEGIFSYK